MKALSIRQPWASLIVMGIKDIENRTWPTRHRGSVLVHAAKGMTRDKFRLLCANCNQGRQRNGGICPHQQQEARRA